MKSIRRLAATSAAALATLSVLGAALLGATLTAPPAVADHDLGPTASLQILHGTRDAHWTGSDDHVAEQVADTLTSLSSITPEERARLEGLAAIWLQALPSDLVDSFLAYLDEVEGAPPAN